MRKDPFDVTEENDVIEERAAHPLAAVTEPTDVERRRAVFVIAWELREACSLLERPSFLALDRTQQRDAVADAVGLARAMRVVVKELAPSAELVLAHLRAADGHLKAADGYPPHSNQQLKQLKFSGLQAGEARKRASDLLGVIVHSWSEDLPMEDA